MINGVFQREPTRAIDYFFVILISLVSVMMVLGNIVILRYRNYRPIKSKSVLLTLMSSLGGLIWIIAAIIVNDHFPRRRHSGLDICSLWTYWLQACFGFALWLNCLTLRLITLYRIFICERNSLVTLACIFTCRRDSPWLDFPLLILLLLPAIVFSIVASAKNQMKWISFSPPPSSSSSDTGDCKFEAGTLWAYGLIALLIIYFLIFLGFSFKLRNTMAQFNEYRLIRRGGILSLFLFLLSLVMLYTRAYYKAVGRCFLSAAVASTIFYYFFARNGVVIYNVLLNRASYLERFNADLTRAPSENERERTAFAYKKSERQLKEVRAEIQGYRDKIKQLEDEVKELELAHSGLQQRTSTHSSVSEITPAI